MGRKSDEMGPSDVASIDESASIIPNNSSPPARIVIEENANSPVAITQVSTTVDEKEKINTHPEDGAFAAQTATVIPAETTAETTFVDGTTLHETKADVKLSSSSNIT